MASFQGIVVMDHSSYYGSRSMIDQHRDMRLDIDNMSYEVPVIFLCLHFSLPSSICLLVFLDCCFHNFMPYCKKLTWAGTHSPRREDRKCQHWVVRWFDFKEPDWVNLLFVRPISRRGNLCYLFGENPGCTSLFMFDRDVCSLGR